jgi:hypothetical protein
MDTLLFESLASWDRNHLSSPLIFEAHLDPLPVMASEGDHNKRPWGGSPTLMVTSHHLVVQG